MDQNEVRYEVVGIDLGTTNSAISHWDARFSERPEILPCSQTGNNIIPSIVGTREGNFEFGVLARDSFSTNYKNTAYEIKRIIGRTVRQIGLNSFEELRKNVTYTLVSEGEDKAPKVQFRLGDEHIGLEPWQISKLLLEHLRRNAIEQLKTDEREVRCEAAVITVPAYFQDEQRTATRRAAEAAGFTKVILMSEPVAAAYHYGLSIRRQDNGEFLQLVFDMGGGTTDLSIVEANNGNFRELRFTGHTRFGGSDFDMALMRHFNERVMRLADEKGWNGASYDVFAPGKEEIRYTLREHCIKLKELFGIGTKTARLMLPNIYGRQFPTMEMSLVEFESARVCGPLIDRAVEMARAFMADADMGPEEFNVHRTLPAKVLFMGGATRLPAFRRLFEQRLGFRPAQFIACKHLDTGVALGAAIHAVQQLGDAWQKTYAAQRSANFARSIAKEVGMPIGIRGSTGGERGEDVCEIVFTDEYPAIEERQYGTDHDEVYIEIYENHRRSKQLLPRISECRCLCRFTVDVRDLKKENATAALLVRLVLNDDRVLRVHALNAVTRRTLGEHQTKCRTVLDLEGDDEDGHLPQDQDQDDNAIADNDDYDDNVEEREAEVDQEN